MKQIDLIDELRRSAKAAGETLTIDNRRKGIRLSLGKVSIKLGPDNRADIDRRFIRTYSNRLGLTSHGPDTNA